MSELLSQCTSDYMDETMCMGEMVVSHYPYYKMYVYVCITGNTLL